MEVLEINSTKDAIEEFKKSILWNDIVKELESWKEGFKIERDGIVEDASENNPSTASVLLHLGDINGRLKAVDYMLSIPDVFLSILESRKEEKDGRD